MRKSERGMSSAPFIVTLVLLLVFVFLWWDQKGEKDKTVEENTKLKAQIDSPPPAATPGLNQHIAALEQLLNDITREVGFATLKVEGKQDGLPVSNPADIHKALDDKGAFGEMKAAATVRLANQQWKPTKGVQGQGAVSVTQLPPTFKDKVKEVIAAEPGSPPSPPADPDDAAAVAQYQSALSDWKAKSAKYTELIDQLVKMEGFKEYSAVLGDASIYDPDKPGVVDWTFWDRPASSAATLEEFVKLPAPILRNIRDSYIAAVNSARTIKEGDDKSIKELRDTIDNADPAHLGLKQQLETEQKAHSDDVARLQGEAAASRADNEKLRQSETTAQAALAAEKESHRKDTERSTQTITAFQNRAREDKEKFDVQIQRNDPDGALLAVDSGLGTGHISLGSADHVYPGLVFEVSYVGRGALRVKKGTVVVTKVLDAHYSQVRIVDQVAGERPMSSGDIIANPFYDKSKTIHVYLAGDLRKYPKGIATDRLRRTGAVVDDAIGTATDFIVVPDSMTVSPTPAPAGDAAAAGATKEESPYDRLYRLSKQFGASLVTERMIEHFLDY
jgi:hypothetical protein